ncbi:hypothetical protein HETIRDRAFT_317536 [Heterobasidion irregulare TC 32-1]|uniref:BTB domain-containing protein n=1 Tax=Heterobasidion irregulare (strain TC 32-1) TaxID=747525 RepID=W4K6V8_HETIT|nr:uncharacterized protein HETIRDRAFT_317536 [Heterobasidion irregulare TC 32-1]ETW81577.1 hypothetical protein HETIRDRAFT_317536 [Heterobasidion irregulare TC 32-1]
MVPVEKRGEPWFEDGNIILIAHTEDNQDGVAFKVHRGILSRHSEIFRTMFEIPQGFSDAEMLDDCLIVRMYDLPNELSNLITALYDGATFHHRSIEDFFFLAGILRLSTKYFISHLRTQAIRHLTRTWPYTLRGHDEMVALALSSPTINDTSYPYVHPLHVLNLAREVNVQLVIPAALYFLSIYALEDLQKADHPKLLTEHPSRPSSHLSDPDVKYYTLMYQYRMKMILSFARHTVASWSAGPSCQGTKKECTRSITRLASYIYSSLTPRTGLFHNMTQIIEVLADDTNICTFCERAFRRDVTDLREKFWTELPGVVGLPGWDELEAMDINAQPS